MKPFTNNQKKAGLIIALILVIAHFTPQAATLLSRAIGKHMLRTATKKPAVSPNVIYMPAPTPSPSDPAFPLEAQARFLGVWDGTQMGDDNCQIHLELRASPFKPGYIAGYETRVCWDLAKYITHRTANGGLADALKAKSPLATELNGTFSQGNLHFDVWNSIGGSEYTCPLSSYSILPWGTQDVIAQWKASGGCPDGQMILKRGRG